MKEGRTRRRYRRIRRMSISMVFLTTMLVLGSTRIHALTSPTSTPTKAIPGWWKNMWKMAPRPGEPGSPIGVGDFLGGIRKGLEDDLFQQSSSKNSSDASFYHVPEAVNTDPSSMQSNFFENIRKFRTTMGPIFSINLGVTKVIYIGDPLVTKGILLNAGGYDKGLVGLIGKDVFGDGLITALDRDVWRRRRQAVAPTMGANQRWLNALVDDFASCTVAAFPRLDAVADASGGDKDQTEVDLEETCLAIALDALGVTVFGTQFEASTRIGQNGGDPLVQAVYRVLKETNIRAEDPSSVVAAAIRPMWLAEAIFPKLKEFRDASRLLDGEINELIANLKQTVEGDEGSAGLDATPSILRILIESRDEATTTSQQVKDDLVTLLIAGHETVASVLTWTLYELARNPTELKVVQDEIDEVLGTKNDPSQVTLQDVKRLAATRRALTEALRLYPAPPLLSRRALKEDILPLTDGSSPPLRLKRGDNIFLLTAMLQRDPRLYGENDAENFRPNRWLNPIVSDPELTPGWMGYSGPEDSSLYPSERATDFGLIGFGAGEFKCVGDKFAFVEATVVLALLLQRYEVALTTEDVGFDMAGTIHTRSGLQATLRRRKPQSKSIAPGKRTSVSNNS